jgi:acetoacetyl-CoA synthetase
MHRRAGCDAHPDGRDLAFDPVVVCCQPDTRAPSDSPSAEAVFSEYRDQSLFKSSYVVNDEDGLGQPDDRVAHELTRPVPGDLASPIDVDHRRAIEGAFLRLGALARCVDAGVLQEQHGVRSGPSGYFGVDGALQVPRRLVVDVLATQPKIEEGQCHGAESNVVCMATNAPEVLWTPQPATARTSSLAEFARFARERRRVAVDELDYASLHAWSVRDLDAFWSAAAEFLGVRFHTRPVATLASATMPGVEWFPGSTLNYAEHALADGPGRGDDDLAVVFVREDGLERLLSYGELRDLVGRVRAGLLRLGVGRGDRVVAVLPNCTEAVAAFLAVASLGATWSSCSPDFGGRAMRDRFAQLEPSVLLAVDGYRYGGKAFDIRERVRTLRQQLPSLSATVLVPYLDAAAQLDGTSSWAELTAEPGPLEYDAVPFDHPLWVLYSSGTTGLPKGIVHGHGGIVVEHLKTNRLHHDLGPGERFFWFTTTGWMMWNLLVSGLLTGSTVVLYDGDPGHPDLTTLWKVAEKHRVTYFGVSAPYIHACLKAGIRPVDEFDLSTVRAVGSTGAPLSPEGFRWVADAVGTHIQICSMSGGSDLCTAFLESAPTVPVWIGELSCAALGASVAAYDAGGVEVVDEVGELVLTKPMPSMPVSFWNDPDGSRLRAAYFDDYPGVWRHGDWVRRTPRGSYVIYGRSDSTLKRGGVRMGTADFYAVVESHEQVLDSLVIDTTELGAATDGELVCFLVLAPGATLAQVAPQLKQALRTELSPRHVPDRFLVVQAIPRTLNGKKCEVPVKRILAGADPDQAVSRDALQNPESLGIFIEIARR